MIKEVIVVEGKEDTRRLKEIFGYVQTIETRGSAISEVTLEEIKKAQDTKGIIIFTDPDYPGQRIRHIINQAVPGCKNAYMAKNKAIDHRKKKIGVEHCSNEDIKEALSKIITIDTDFVESDVAFSDLIELGLVGMSGSNELRDYISLKLNLGHNNAKQLYRKIHFYHIQLKTLIELKNQYIIDRKR